MAITGTAGVAHTSTGAEAALLEHLKAPVRQPTRGKFGQFILWMTKAIASKVALIVIGTLVWWLFLLFMLGWFTKGSALEAGVIVLNFISAVAVGFVRWILDSVLPDTVPQWSIHVLEASVAFATLACAAYAAAWAARSFVMLLGQSWYGGRWAIAEAWWRSPVYGENLRDGLKAAAALAVVWLVIAFVFNLPILSHPVLWAVVALFALLMLGAALSELVSLPRFLHEGDQELAIAILENDWERARSRHEIIMSRHAAI